jgi:radical SAM superfamily enzyme YgiQ (UPF0313 family)
MRIFLVSPPAEVPSRVVNYPGFAPLGPLTAAGYLEQRGHQVAVWEALAVAAPAEVVRRRGDRLRLGPEPPAPALAPALAAADMVVFPLDMFRHPEGAWGAAVKRLSRAVKARRGDVATVVADCYVGGVDYVPVDPAALLAALPDVDCYVRGEPELALGDLADGAAPGAVPGVWRRGAAPAAEWTRAVEDLDEVPPPAWHLVDAGRYLRSQAVLVTASLVHEYHGPGRPLPLMSSRGCPYRCSFCSSGAGHRHRALSAAAFQRHLERLLSFGTDTLFFLDDVMNLDLERFKAIMRLLAGARVAWTAANGLRADRLDAEAIRLFRDSGGFGLSVSAESGDPRVLREVIGKGLVPDDARRAAGLAAAERVPLMVHYVVGFPGEGVAAAGRTLALAAELWEEHAAEPRVQFATPVPGTPLHDAAAAAGLLPRPLTRVELLEAFVAAPTLDPPDLPAPLLEGMLTLLERRIAGARRPRLLLDPTRRCNQQCTFCSAVPHAGPDLDEETLGRALAAGRARGARGVDLGGGEPTLVAGLPRLVARARGLGYDDVGLVTNGRTLHVDDLARRLAEAGVTRFLVSAPAHTEALSAGLTRTPGALRDTLAGLEALFRLPGVDVALNLIACRTSAPHLADIVACHGRRFPFRVINVQVVMPLGDALATGEALESYEVLLPQLHAALALADVPPIAVQNLPACALPERPWLALLEGCKRDRLTLAKGGTLVPFAGVVGAARRRADFCDECPAAVACAGLDARLLPRYAAERDRPRRVADALRRAPGRPRGGRAVSRPPA